MAVKQHSSNYFSKIPTFRTRSLNALIAGSSVLEQQLDTLDGFPSTLHTYAGVSSSEDFPYIFL